MGRFTYVPMSKILIILIAVIAILVFAGVGTYNGLVGKQQAVDAS